MYFSANISCNNFAENILSISIDTNVINFVENI